MMVLLTLSTIRGRPSIALGTILIPRIHNSISQITSIVTPTPLASIEISSNIWSLVWIMANRTTIPPSLRLNGSCLNHFRPSSTSKSLSHQILGQENSLTNSFFPNACHNLLHIIGKSRNKQFNSFVLGSHHSRAQL